MRTIELPHVPPKVVKGSTRPALPAMLIRISDHAIARFRVRAPMGQSDDPVEIAKLVRRWWHRRRSVIDNHWSPVDLVPLPAGGCDEPGQWKSFAVVKPDRFTFECVVVVTVLSQSQVDSSMSTGFYVGAT